MVGPADWHKRIAEIVGGLSFAVARRKVSREQLTQWAAILEKVAAEMRGMLK